MAHTRWQPARTGIAIVLAVLVVGAAFTTLPSVARAATLPAPGQYVPLTPARLINDHTLGADTAYMFSPLGLGGVPTSGVAAVSLLVSTRSTGTGVIEVHATGITRPIASHLNYRPNLSTTNSVVTRLGDGNRFTVHNLGSGSARLYVDVVGYFKLRGSAPAGSTYVPLQPARIAANVPVSAGGNVLVDPRGKGGVPARNVSAVVANVVVRGSAPGYATVWPDGATRPPTSDVNYQTDFVYSNQVTAKLGTNGFRVYTTTATEIYVDVVGYYQTADGVAAGSTFATVDPFRMFNEVIIPGNGSYTVAPLGQGGIPTSGVSAVAFNLTAVARTNLIGHLTVHPSGTPRPPTHQLTYREGGLWPVLQIAKLGADGKVTIHNNGDGEIRILLDLAGYFRAPVQPGAPTAVTATAQDGQAVVRWAPPVSDGGAAITGYRITANPGAIVVDVVDTTSAIVAGLANGAAYTFTVSAQNAVARGPTSAASSPITPRAATAPAAPTGVTVEPRDRSAFVRWTRPPDGGKPISSYVVTASPGGATTTVPAPATEALVTNLANGTTYTVTVAAVNAVGAGPAGTAAPVLPKTTVPDPPRRVVAGSAGGGAVTVDWSRPTYTGGSPITGYVITAQPGGATVSTGPDATTVDVSGLAAGTAYTFTVAARNAIGTGSASPPSRPVKPDLQLASGVRELSPAALATLTIAGASSLVFTNAPGDVRALTAGTVVLGYASTAAPDGFVRRVEAVTTSGTTTTIATTNVRPWDAFTAGSFSLEGDLTGDAGSAALADFDLGGTISVPINNIKLRDKVFANGSVQMSMRFGVRYDEVGDTILWAELKATVKVSVSSGERGGAIRYRLLLKDTDVKALKVGKFLKPAINAETYLWLEGSIGNDSTLPLSVTQTSRTEVNVTDRGATGETDTTFELTPPTSAIEANLKGGVGVDLVGEWTFFDLARVKLQGLAALTVKPAGNPWLKLEECYRVGAEAAEGAWKSDSLINRCRELYSSDDAILGIPITPQEVRLARGATTTFTARNRYAQNPMTWEVVGEDNGTITQDGVYTAPDKDGMFIVRVFTKARPGIPAESGQAVVRIGTPNPPTVTVAPTTPSSNGAPRVRITITATGPQADHYEATIVPYTSNNRCLGYWTIPGTGTYTLVDYLEVEPSYRCGIMVPGNTYTFTVIGHNEHGASLPAASNPVTITG